MCSASLLYNQLIFPYPRAFAVGFTSLPQNLNHLLPGWGSSFGRKRHNSQGYHADDGFYYSNGMQMTYAGTWGSGDVIGCGLNVPDGKIYFVKNRKHLGKRFCG